MTTVIRSRDGNDPRWLDPNRDLAHCFPEILHQVAKNFDDHRWPALQAYLELNGLSEDDMVQTLDAVCTFVGIATEDSRETIEDCLARSGFLDLPQPAVVAFNAMVGNVILGTFFDARRRVAFGADTVFLPRNFMSNIHRMKILLTMPRWRRKLYVSWKRFRQAFWKWRN